MKGIWIFEFSVQLLRLVLMLAATAKTCIDATVVMSLWGVGSGDWGLELWYDGSCTEMMIVEARIVVGSCVYGK